MSRILGLDLSLTHTGIVVIEDSHVVYYKTVGESLKDPDDIQKIERIHRIVETVVGVVKDEKVDAIGIEKTYWLPGRGDAPLQLTGLLMTMQYVLYRQTGGVPLLATASEARKFMMGKMPRMKSKEWKKKIEEFFVKVIGPTRLRDIDKLNEHERDAYVIANFIAGNAMKGCCSCIRAPR